MIPLSLIIKTLTDISCEFVFKIVSIFSKYFFNIIYSLL